MNHIILGARPLHAFVRIEQRRPSALEPIKTSTPSIAAEQNSLLEGQGDGGGWQFGGPVWQVDKQGAAFLTTPAPIFCGLHLNITPTTRNSLELGFQTRVKCDQRLRVAIRLLLWPLKDE